MLGNVFFKHKNLSLMRYFMNIHTQLYQPIERWVDIVKQIAKPELLIYLSF